MTRPIFFLYIITIKIINKNFFNSKIKSLSNFINTYQNSFQPAKLYNFAFECWSLVIVIQFLGLKRKKKHFKIICTNFFCRKVKCISKLKVIHFTINARICNKENKGVHVVFIFGYINKGVHNNKQVDVIVKSLLGYSTKFKIVHYTILSLPLHQQEQNGDSIYFMELLFRYTTIVPNHMEQKWGSTKMLTFLRSINFGEYYCSQ